MSHLSRLFFFLCLCLAPMAARTQPMDFDQKAETIRNLLNELVATNTTNPPGNEERAVKIGAGRLDKAGIPYEITEFAPGRKNLVARLKGNGTKRPLLLLAHTDVVSAENQKWTTEPHKMAESNGYLVGRGVGDDLGYAATAMELFVSLKESKIPLQRDVILAWTGDEEAGGSGIQYIIKNNRGQIDAEFALNEGGGVRIGEDGKPKFVGIEVAQKTYQDMKVIAKGPTGHSSVPLEDNAIYRLSRALQKLALYHPPARLLPVTRAYFQGRARIEEPRLAKAMLAVAQSKGKIPADNLKIVEENPVLRAQLRTTCIATQLNGGSAPNALPSEAEANINCRILPDETVEETRRLLIKIFDDNQIEVKVTNDMGKARTAGLDGEVVDAIKKVTAKKLNGVPVLFSMSSGATDSRYLRDMGVQAYGIGPIFITESDGRRAHGIDERISLDGLRRGMEFFYNLILEIAAPQG